MANPSNRVSSYLTSQIAEGSFPGAQYVIGEDRVIIAEDALGAAVIEPERIAVTVDTIYDLASLTKPLVTALLVVLSSERKALNLSDPLSLYLPEFAGTEHRITLFELLTHTSGLPNWRPLYAEAGNREEIPAAIARVSPQPSATGAEKVLYSDLNYILLGFVLERVTGERLDRLADREVFRPLGLKRTMFNPGRELIREIAATERGQEFELANALADIKRRYTKASKFELAGTASSHLFGPHSSGNARSPGTRDPWRKEVIWGEVHDGNAHFMGGVAGHAGLFSTSREVFQIANQFLDGSDLLNPESLRMFRENLTPAGETARSIAWIRAETPDCSGGPALPPDAIGHNGFTGGSIWMDPNRRRVFILLTNRVHPHVDAIDMREIRRRFNALAADFIRESKSLS